MKTELKINDIKERSASLFAPNGRYIGEVKSILSLYDVRLQIRRRALSGYYVVFDGEVSEIHSNGQIDANFNGFEFLDRALRELAFGHQN